ncbi:hypothetical protein CcaCcLH18_13308 [Colletotrichum camelliae]|nr:hypothetical protein CcaCcLH18_13308 [Colletotrichum camelliae]
MAPSSVQDLFDTDSVAPTKVRNGPASTAGYNANFEIFRRLVPLASDGKITHLNAGFMPPSNLIVDEAIRRFCSESLHHPSPKACWRQDVEAVRQLLALYINTDPSSIAFVRDTTEGLGSFIHGLKFEPGDNVVILDCEHPNQAFGWIALRPFGLEVRLVPTDPERPAAANAKTFAPYRTMERHRRYVDVQALGVSAAAFSLHKGLNTPTGFAALYVDSAVIEELDPTPPLVGYGGVASVSDSEDFMIPEGPIVFHPTARRYEHANMSFISAVAARAFLQFYLEVMGSKNVENHLYGLGDALRKSCAELGISVLGPKERRQHAPHLHVLQLHDPRWLEHLKASGVIVTRFRSGIRVSFGFYNNLRDVDRLVSVLSSGMALGISSSSAFTDELS